MASQKALYKYKKNTQQRHLFYPTPKKTGFYTVKKLMMRKSI